MSFKESILKELSPYLLSFEKKLEEAIPSFGPETPLRDAVIFSLKNGGKRFRPALVLIVAKALGLNEDASDAALGVEFFHTASLIADDLPCMDDDDTRRDKPSLHKLYGEATALLASYALISAGYDRIRLNAQDKPEKCLAAFENASYNTGIFGATGGQYLDLFAKTHDEATLKEIIQKKTGTLFELSFVLGWIFGGGEIAKLPLIKKGALHFGTAFQIVDDFQDLEKDRKEGRKINAPLILGEKAARQWLSLELQAFEKTLRELKLQSKELMAMGQTLATSSS